MTPRRAEHLLGGYATGTLTPEERERLFRAAMQDQQLFDALADEEALRELLSDPAVRERLVAVLSSEPAARPRGLASWLWRPWPMAAAASLAGLSLVGVYLSVRPESKKAVQVAQVRTTASEALQEVPDTAPEPARTAPPAAVAGRVRDQAAPALVPPSQPASPAVEARQLEGASAEARKASPPPSRMEPPPLADKQVEVRQNAVPQFEYWIERRGDDGAYAALASNERLARSASVRLRVEAHENGYLTLVASGASDQRAVERGKTYLLHVPAGESSVGLAFSRQPVGLSGGATVQSFREAKQAPGENTAVDSASALRKARAEQAPKREAVLVRGDFASEDAAYVVRVVIPYERQ